MPSTSSTIAASAQNPRNISSPSEVAVTRKVGRTPLRLASEPVGLLPQKKCPEQTHSEEDSDHWPDHAHHDPHSSLRKRRTSGWEASVATGRVATDALQPLCRLHPVRLVAGLRLPSNAPIPLPICMQRRWVPRSRPTKPGAS